MPSAAEVLAFLGYDWKPCPDDLASFHQLAAQSLNIIGQTVRLSRNAGTVVNQPDAAMWTAAILENAAMIVAFPDSALSIEPEEEGDYTDTFSDRLLMRRYSWWTSRDAAALVDDADGWERRYQILCAWMEWFEDITSSNPVPATMGEVVGSTAHSACIIAGTRLWAQHAGILRTNAITGGGLLVPLYQSIAKWDGPQFDRECLQLEARLRGELRLANEALERSTGTAPESAMVPAEDSPSEIAIATRSRRMTWQQARAEAESHIARNPFPGVNALARLVGCSQSTMSRAVRESPKLLAAKLRHESENKSVSDMAMPEGAMESTPHPDRPMPCLRGCCNRQALRNGRN